MKITKVLTALTLSVLCSSCSPFMDSPFSDRLLRPERNLNAKNLNRLADIEADGIIRIAVFSDSHQNYKALDKTFFQMNQTTGIDFVAGLGDFTNSAYNLEYDQFIDGLKQLTLPSLMAIGNHDSIGAGPELFRKAFGELNFWFESSSHRYIFFQSSNLEDPDNFDPAWLKARVEESTKPVFIFSHVQLRDPERYFDSDATVLGEVIASPKVQMILNGHNHVYDLLIDNGTVMLQCGRVEPEKKEQHWLLLEIQGNQLCVKRMDTGGTDCRMLK